MSKYYIDPVKLQALLMQKEVSLENLIQRVRFFNPEITDLKITSAAYSGGKYEKYFIVCIAYAIDAEAKDFAKRIS